MSEDCKEVQGWISRGLRKSVPGRGNSTCKGAKIGNSKEGTHLVWSTGNEEQSGNEVREVRRGRWADWGLLVRASLLVGVRWDTGEGLEQRKDVIQVSSQ